MRTYIASCMEYKNILRKSGMHAQQHVAIPSQIAIASHIAIVYMIIKYS